MDILEFGTNGQKMVPEQRQIFHIPHLLLKTIKALRHIIKNNQKLPQNVTVASVSPSYNPKIQWDRNSDWFVESYKVFRNGSEIATVAQTLNADIKPYYIDPDITWSGINAGDMQVSYYTKAVSNVGVQSPQSATVTITTYKNIQKKGEVSRQGIPTEFFIDQNYPNPFNPTTEIEYSIAEPSFVTLAVFNSAGQAVTQLVKEYKGIGNYSVTWNAANLPSGVYFYNFTAGKFSSQKKMLLVK